MKVIDVVVLKDFLGGELFAIHFYGLSLAIYTHINLAFRILVYVHCTHRFFSLRVALVSMNENHRKFGEGSFVEILKQLSFFFYSTLNNDSLKF